MIVKTHMHDGKLILAICDTELLGKKFIDDGKQLDLSSDFYNGKKTTEKELRAMVKKAYILNIVGKKSVEFAISQGLVAKEHTASIKNIPYAQALLMQA
jgi:hypothetical protein